MIWRKDRFKNGRRKYFQSFPCNFYTHAAMGLYFREAYNLAEGKNYYRRWFECLNKTIYRIARTIGRDPSRINARIIAIWAECRSEGVAEVLRAIRQFEHDLDVVELSRKAARTGESEDLRAYLDARRQEAKI